MGVDLGAFMPGGWSEATAINNNREIAGWTTIDSTGLGVIHAALWHQGMLDTLPAIPGYAIHQARDLNNTGMIVGWAAGNIADSAVAVVWRLGQPPLVLGHLSGEATVAYGVNDAGTVIGSSNGNAFAWTAAAGMANLTPPGFLGSEATRINNAGAIVGYASDTLGYTHPLRWNPDGSITDLLPAGSLGAFLLDINSAGGVAGFVDPAGGEATATRWTPNGSVIPLQIGPYSQANGLSDRGRTVGYLGDVSTPLPWTKYKNSLTSLPLPPASPSNGMALDVNTCGSVVGWAWAASGPPTTPHAMLWKSTACDP